MLFKAICAGLLGLYLSLAHSAACIRPNAITPDGGRYCGPLVNGKLQGRGVLAWGNGSQYEGEFANGLMSGRGRLRTAAGEIYEGEFRNGLMHGRGRLQMNAGSGDKSIYRGQFVNGRQEGKGRLESANGNVYEGEFKDNQLTSGTLTSKDGSRYQGGFLKWRFHGKGSYTDTGGNIYEGQFVEGELRGNGRLSGKRRGRYEGEFRQWRFHGQGVLRLPDGDIYKGEFVRGFYEGKGTLTYAKPKADGRTQDSGVWRYGTLVNEKEAQQAQENVEAALYNQRRLLDSALVALSRRNPGKINMYLLAVAGDGSQEVFRREVEFVREQFAARFGMQGYSLALINSRNTLATAPMATHTSIREALKSIAARMDTEQDILFFFLTSHGSQDHEFSINQNNINLRGLQARDLGAMLRESGIRWKVVVVSACYSGGFIDAIKDDFTLVITAARHDRSSFGCADDNDFTYFGQAYFKESLPRARSFEEAFSKTEILVREWEDKDRKAEGKTAEESYSFPQIYSPAPIRQRLRQWWNQYSATQ